VFLLSNTQAQAVLEMFLIFVSLTDNGCGTGVKYTLDMGTRLILVFVFLHNGNVGHLLTTLCIPKMICSPDKDN
jgi:hypothetical protein